jgi:hypothetical protein
MPLLDTNKGVEGAYNGFIFGVRALESDITVTAVWATTMSNSAVPVKVYYCQGTWGDFKAQPQAWHTAAESTIPDKRSMHRIDLQAPIPVRAGSTVGLYVHTRDPDGVGFNSSGTRITAADSSVQIMTGAPSGSHNPFENIKGSKWAFAGRIEYVAGAQTQPAPLAGLAPPPPPQYHSPSQAAASMVLFTPPQPAARAPPQQPAAQPPYAPQSLAVYDPAAATRRPSYAAAPAAHTAAPAGGNGYAGGNDHGNGNGHGYAGGNGNGHGNAGMPRQPMTRQEVQEVQSRLSSALAHINALEQAEQEHAARNLTMGARHREILAQRDATHQEALKNHIVSAAEAITDKDADHRVLVEAAEADRAKVWGATVADRLEGQREAHAEEMAALRVEHGKQKVARHTALEVRVFKESRPLAHARTHSRTHSLTRALTHSLAPTAH